jgi:beta-lactamase class A
MDTMSIIKIPLLLTLLKKVEEGTIDLHQEITITNGHKRFGTGIISSLDAGIKISIRDAAVLMISLSDNSATDILYDVIGGFEEVNICMAELGFNQIKCLGTSFDWFQALASSIDPIAARIPIIATTTNNSIKENPDFNFIISPKFFKVKSRHLNRI